MNTVKMQKWRVTAQEMELLAKQHDDSCLIQDELGQLGQLDHKEAQEVLKHSIELLAGTHSAMGGEHA